MAKDLGTVSIKKPMSSLTLGRRKWLWSPDCALIPAFPSRFHEGRLQEASMLEGLEVVGGEVLTHTSSCLKTWSPVFHVDYLLAWTKKQTWGGCQWL